MDKTEHAEPEWREVRPRPEFVSLHLASDLRHNGVYLLSPDHFHLHVLSLLAASSVGMTCHRPPTLASHMPYL